MAESNLVRGGKPDRRNGRGVINPPEPPFKPKEKSVDLLEWFVDYELRAAARYRRFATLVMVSAVNSRVDLGSMLLDCIRHSDEFFATSNGAVILMGETDSTGALAAVERYKTVANGDTDLRFGIASYPTDGTAPAELLTTVERRLNEARVRQYGAIVSAG